MLDWIFKGKQTKRFGISAIWINGIFTCISVFFSLKCATSRLWCVLFRWNICITSNQSVEGNKFHFFSPMKQKRTDKNWEKINLLKIGWPHSNFSFELFNAFTLGNGSRMRSTLSRNDKTYFTKFLLFWSGCNEGFGVIFRFQNDINCFCFKSIFTPKATFYFEFFKLNKVHRLFVGTTPIKFSTMFSINYQIRHVYNE